VTEKLGDAGLELLRRFANVDCAYELTAEELRAKVSLVDALVVRSATRVTREVFEAARGRLRVVGRAGVGIDNVDLQAATEAGCLVVNAPTANTVAAAEHAIALLAAMARNVAQADASLKAGTPSFLQTIKVTTLYHVILIIELSRILGERYCSKMLSQNSSVFSDR
jgi:D-3-phosphoglycerate dehydrogenase